MAQTFTEDSFAAGHAGLTDLQNMENNFMALKTLFSGSSAPANSTGGMPWFDTGKKILKIRNSTNGAWLGVHYSGSASRWWVFANSADDGWVVDSSISDRVIGITGGSYGAVGLQGFWGITGLTASGASADHQHTVNVHSHTLTMGLASVGTTDEAQISVVTDVAASTAVPTGYMSADHTHAIFQNSSWRPAAAVGTLQYLDL
jgi:hypothetical protein